MVEEQPCWPGISGRPSVMIAGQNTGKLWSEPNLVK